MVLNRLRLRRLSTKKYFWENMEMKAINLCTGLKTMEEEKLPSDTTRLFHLPGLSRNIRMIFLSRLKDTRFRMSGAPKTHRKEDTENFSKWMLTLSAPILPFPTQK